MRINCPQVFDDNILDDETREKIKPLVDYINTANKTMVQALQGRLSIRDNIACSIKEITVKHGVKQNLSGGGIGMIIINSSVSSPIESYLLQKTNGGIDCTVYFKDATLKGDVTQSDLTILIFNG